MKLINIESHLLGESGSCPVDRVAANFLPCDYWHKILVESMICGNFFLSKLSTSRSQFVGQILNSDLGSSYFLFNTPTVTVTEKFGAQRKIWILEEKFGINCDLRWIIWNKLFFGRCPIWHREGYYNINVYDSEMDIYNYLWWRQPLNNIYGKLLSFDSTHDKLSLIMAQTHSLKLMSL